MPRIAIRPALLLLVALMLVLALAGLATVRGRQDLHATQYCSGVSGSPGITVCTPNI